MVKEIKTMKGNIAHWEREEQAFLQDQPLTGVQGWGIPTSC